MSISESFYTREDRHRVPTLDEFKKYFLNAKYYLSFFNIETIKTALQTIELKDLSKEVHIPAEQFFCSFEYKYYVQKQNFPVSAKNVTMQYAEFERDVTKGRKVVKEKVSGIVPCYSILIPQTTYSFEPKFFRECLLIEYPYLAKYNFTCYHFDSEKVDIYIQPRVDKSKGTNPALTQLSYSFYCPIQALKERNIYIAYRRHMLYFLEYYNPVLFKGVSPAQVLEWQAIMLNIINEPDIIEFKEDVTKGPIEAQPQIKNTEFEVTLPILVTVDGTRKIRVVLPDNTDEETIIKEALKKFKEYSLHNMKYDSSKPYKINKVD